MRFFKYIIRSVNLLNIILIITVIFFARYAVLPVLNKNIKNNFPEISNISLAAAEEEKPAGQPVSSLSEFVIVAEHDLFHQDRVIPVEKITADPVPTPEIILYGTLIMDNESYAYIEDKKSPYTTPGRGKRQLVFKKGSKIGGYTLTDIKSNKIELVKGEDKMTVNIMDFEKPKTRDISASSIVSASNNAVNKKSAISRIPPQIKAKIKQMKRNNTN